MACYSVSYAADCAAAGKALDGRDYPWTPPLQRLQQQQQQQLHQQMMLSQIVDGAFGANATQNQGLPQQQSRARRPAPVDKGESAVLTQAKGKRKLA